MKRGQLGQKVREAGGGGGGDFLDLKEVGIAVIHVHSNADVGEDAEVEERMVVWVPAEPEEEDGKKGGKKRRQNGYKRRFSFLRSEGCVFVDFLEALEADKAIGDDDVVLSGGGEEYTKSEILGEGDWMKDLRPSTEFLFAVVASSVGNEKVTEAKLQVLAAKPSLAKAIDSVVDAQVREHGEAGEASVGMYGIEIVYNDDAPARDKYKASYNGRKPTAAIKELLEGDGVDLLKLCKSSNLDEMEGLLAAALVVQVEGFELSPGGERETRGGGRGGAARTPDRKGAAARAGERQKPGGGGRAAPPKEDPKPPARGGGRRPVEPDPEPEEEEDETDPASGEGGDEESEEDRELREAEEAAAAAREKAEARKKAKAAEEEAKKAADKKPPAGKPAADKKAPAGKPDAGGAADTAEVQCPKCSKMTVISATQKHCTHCKHKVIPW